MASHTTLEQLSGYLDRELGENQRRAVAEHVGECAACRERLAGLERVVRKLKRLESAGVPAGLGHLVERQVASLRPSRGTLHRLGDRTAHGPAQPPLLGLFGVLLALAIILFLFSYGVARREADHLELIYQRSPAEEGVADAGAAAAAEADVRELAGRRFRLVGELWLEEGVDADAPAWRIESGSPGLEPELVAEIERLRPLGGPVRFRFRDRLVEIDPAP